MLYGKALVSISSGWAMILLLAACDPVSKRDETSIAFSNGHGREICFYGSSDDDGSRVFINIPAEQGADCNFEGPPVSCPVTM